jgi:steroid delta-isomerase-like uncharacterized protein
MIFYNSSDFLPGIFVKTISMKHLLYLVSFILFSEISNAQVKHQKEVNMQNKEVIKRLYDEVLNKRNPHLLRELLSPDYEGSNLELVLHTIINAFPDAHWQVRQMIAEDDKVVVFQQLQGTHTGMFQDIPATGKKVATAGIVTYDLKNGQIIRDEVMTDRMGFLQALGVLPVDVVNRQDNVVFIDKFIVPATSRAEFMDRVKVNRDFIKTLTGFVKDAAYTQTTSDGSGNLVYVTIAVWKDEATLEKAKAAVQAKYKSEGFDMPAMLKRLHITLDRGTYKEQI